MLYTEFVNKAIDATVVQADNGLFYLEPMWRTILHDNELFFDQISDFAIKPTDIEDVLKLEVVKRNTINTKKNDIYEWLFDLITANIEPAMMKEETEYIKQVVEFMKQNHSDNIVPFPAKE